MGVESNPQNVDALNSNWPAKEEPAKEGYLHLQNLKRAVKARANTAGQFGVTKLSSALDSTAEDTAATSAAVKVVNDKADANAQGLTDLEDQFGSALADAIANLEFGNNKDINKGHQKFPGGFKLNWVRVSGSGTKTLTWDSPFTDAFMFAVSGTSARGYYNTVISNPSKTGCTFVVDGGGYDGKHYVLAGGFDVVA